MADYSDRRFFQYLTPLLLLFLLVLTGCGGGISSPDKKEDETSPDSGKKLPATPSVNNLEIRENQAALITGGCSLNSGTDYQTDLIQVSIDGKNKSTTCFNDQWGVEFPANIFIANTYRITAIAVNYDHELNSQVGNGNLIVRDATGPILPGNDNPEAPTINEQISLESEAILLTGNCTKNKDLINETSYLVVSIEGVANKLAPCRISDEGNQDIWSVNMGSLNEGYYVTSVIAVNNKAEPHSQSDRVTSSLEVSSTIASMSVDIAESKIKAGAKTKLIISFADQLGSPLSGNIALRFSSACIIKGLSVMLDEDDNKQAEFKANGASLLVIYKANGCEGEDSLSIRGTFEGKSVSSPDSNLIIIEKDRVSKIESMGAVPSQIAAQGANGNDVAEVTFKVIGTAQAIIPGKKITFNLEGESGGVRLEDDTPETPEISDVSDSQGLVTVRVRSGYTPGNITVLATYTDTDTGEKIISRSDGLSIARSLTSYGNFNLSINRYSPLSYDRGPTEEEVEPLKIVAIVNDRYGRPVVDGTVVTFQVESTTPNNLAGSIGFVDSSDCRTEGGVCSVNWLPNKNNNASDGYVTILAVAKGEENFIDRNSNGAFDEGDELLDTAEGYLDHKAIWQQIGDRETLVTSNYVEGDYWLQDTNNNGIRDLENNKFDGINCLDPVRCSDQKIIDIVAQITFHQSSREIILCDDDGDGIRDDFREELVVYPDEILRLTGLRFCDKVSGQQIPTGSKINFTGEEGEVVYGTNRVILGDDKLPDFIGINFKASSTVTSAALVTAKIIVPMADITDGKDIVYSRQWIINIRPPAHFLPTQPRLDEQNIRVKRRDTSKTISGTCDASVDVDKDDDGYDPNQGDYKVITDEVKIKIGSDEFSADCSGTWSLALSDAHELTLKAGKKPIEVTSLSRPHPKLEKPNERYESTAVKGQLIVANTPAEATVNNDVDYTIKNGQVYLLGGCTSENTTDVTVTVNASEYQTVVCTERGIWQAELALGAGVYNVRTTAINNNESDKFSDADYYTTLSSYATLITVVN